MKLSLTFLFVFLSIHSCLYAQDAIIGIFVDTANNYSRNVAIQDLQSGSIDTVVDFANQPTVRFTAMDNFNNRYFLMSEDSIYYVLYVVDILNKSYKAYYLSYTVNPINCMRYDPFDNSVVYGQSSDFGEALKFYEFNLDSQTIQPLCDERTVSTYGGVNAAYDFEKKNMLYISGNTQNNNSLIFQNIQSGNITDSIKLGNLIEPCWGTIYQVICNFGYDYLTGNFVGSSGENGCNGNVEVVYNINYDGSKDSLLAIPFGAVLDDQQFCYGMEGHKVFFPSYTNATLKDTMWVVDYQSKSVLYKAPFSAFMGFNEYYGTEADNSIIVQQNNLFVATYGKSYQWYLNGGILQGKTSQTIHPDSAGSYYAMVTALNGQTTQSNKLSYVATGIKTVEPDNSIRVINNPFSVSIDLKSDNDNNSCQVGIYNILGVNVGTINVTGTGTFSFNASALSSGMYFLNMNIDGQRIVKKIVKE